MASVRPNENVLKFFESIGEDVNRLPISPEPTEEGYYRFILDRDGDRRWGLIDYEREFVAWHDWIDPDVEPWGALNLWKAYKAARRADIEAGNASI